MDPFARWLRRLQVAAWIACGCDPSLPRPQVVPPPELAHASVDDGAAVSPTGALLLAFTAPLDPGSVGEASVVLVRGAVDSELLGRLERAALPDDQRDRLAPLRLALSVGGTTVRALPARPLDGGSLYTLVVTTAVSSGGRRLVAPIERAFQTLSASSGAPWITLLSPQPGSSGVVRNLRAVALRFSRPVAGVDEGSLRLVDDDGESIASHVAADEDGVGFRLLLAAPLRPLRRYRVDAGATILDAEGDLPFAIDPAPAFTAGIELREAAPAFVALELAASSGCLVARVSTAPPADARLCIDGSCERDPTIAAAHTLACPIESGEAASVEIVARDESTAPAARLGPLPAPATSPRHLVIAEVLSRPLGSHYAQQFVEVVNTGGEEVSLRGLELQVDAGVSTIGEAQLAPGARALIVPSGFAAEAGADVPPAPGTAIVRVGDSRLGGHGVLIGGSNVTLREPDGRPVSRFSTVGLKLALGQSAERVAACDQDGAYRPTLGGGATPGGP